MTSGPPQFTTIPLPSLSASAPASSPSISSGYSMEPAYYHCYDVTSPSDMSNVASWHEAEQLPSPPADYPPASTVHSELLPAEPVNEKSDGAERTRFGRGDAMEPHPLALQLSFDHSQAAPSLSAPASVSSFSTLPTTFSLDYQSAASGSPCSTSPTTTMHWDSPSSSRAQYVRTYRLPAPTTPPSAHSTSTISVSPNKRPLPVSPSLSAALSVLEQTPPWTSRESARTIPTGNSPSFSLFTTLEAAAETLRRPVAHPLPSLDIDATCPKRPRPFRAVTEPYPRIVKSEEPGTPVSDSPKRSKGKKRPEGHIPRAPNAWILYRSARVKELTETGQAPKLQSDLSKLVASMWREESPDVKETYSRRASIEAKLHAEKHPGHSYKPTQSGQPRRRPTKKKSSDGAGRTRARTTSSLETHLSGFSLSASTSPRDVPSVLMPSPFSSNSPMTTRDYSVDASPFTIDDCPFTPATSTMSGYESTLPSTPSTAATEAWSVFQTSGLSSFDSTLPLPQSHEPYSAPAHLSNFPFSFSQPPPIFEPFHESPDLPSSFDSSHSSCSSISSSAYPSVLLPIDPETPPASHSTYEEYLASLPLDESGQLSVPVPSMCGSHAEETSTHQQDPFSCETFAPSQIPSTTEYSIDLDQFLYH
ncbi:hypothetical protein JCM16303_001472 [Sporobolomyces ruberrimus]